jgi:hypothetical protein
MSAFLIPYIKSHISESNQIKLVKLLLVAVSAAKQIAQLTDSEDKKAYVVDFLERKGYIVMRLFHHRYRLYWSYLFQVVD